MTFGFAIWCIFWLAAIGFLIRYHIQVHREECIKRARGSDAATRPSGVLTPNRPQKPREGPLGASPTESEEIIHADIYSTREGDEPK